MLPSSHGRLAQPAGTTPQAPRPSDDARPLGKAQAERRVIDRFARPALHDLQGGADAAYRRNAIAVEKTAELDRLHAADPDGYVHMSRIYPGLPHWMARKDAETLPWMAASPATLAEADRVAAG
ncbi:hypothetical protein [Sphingomonas sp. RS2018]